MKKLIILFGMVSICGLAKAQNIYEIEGYKPISRPSIYDDDPYEQVQTKQTQTSYKRVTGISKSGTEMPLRITIIDGKVKGVEYYNRTFGWSNCISFSRTTNLLTDDYERIYEYKVTTNFSDINVFYFNL